ncbi:MULTISPECIES: hypothetical protein [Exiguobacterium]|uniref:hypothetical protein n=1 Tax=Exiguobacterium TaxID=33986 RepID=UPI00047D3750|nr:MULTISPECIES: hypothetical protein [Exiguobacterium]MCT4780589.1 hypothetical protein [Exiguobacterium soli]
MLVDHYKQLHHLEVDIPKDERFQKYEHLNIYFEWGFAINQSTEAVASEDAMWLLGQTNAFPICMVFDVFDFSMKETIAVLESFDIPYYASNNNEPELIDGEEASRETNIRLIVDREKTLREMIPFLYACGCHGQKNYLYSMMTDGTDALTETEDFPGIDVSYAVVSVGPDGEGVDVIGPRERIILLYRQVRNR